jgi:hypothetical protein
MGNSALAIFFECVFAGVVSYFFSTLWLSVVEWGILKFWLRPYGKVKRKGFIARVRVTMWLCRFTRFYPFLASLLLTVVWTYFFRNQGAIGLIASAFFAGYWIIPIAIPIKFITEKLPRFSLLTSITAAKRLVASVDLHDVEVVLGWASRRGDRFTSIAAINGYMELTEPWALKALEFMAHDESVEVAQAAKEASALVYSAIYGSGPRSLEKMGIYITKYEEMEEMLRVKAVGLAEKKRILADTGKEMDDIVYSQLKLKEAHPHLYCMSCCAKSEEMQFREWEWIRCKRCHDVVGLKKGVRKIVGEIGGETDRNLVEEVLQVRLWDDTMRQARSAEIDTLLIVGGKPIDYDWAVSAVVQKLHNQSGEQEMRIPIEVKGAVPLSQNSKHLLRGLDPEFSI